MSVRVIEDENHFQAELTAAGIRLVVVDFTASWYVHLTLSISIQISLFFRFFYLFSQILIKINDFDNNKKKKIKK